MWVNTRGPQVQGLVWNGDKCDVDRDGFGMEWGQEWVWYGMGTVLNQYDSYSRQFTEADLLAIGSDVCEAIHKYHKFNKSKT